MRLKVGDVRYMKVGDTLAITEGKTGKRNIVVMNKTIHKSLQNSLSKVRPNDEDMLFASRKGEQAVQYRWSITWSRNGLERSI